MRDLELRGAGDLLGDEQSGHVAAVGFELYVALLDEAVEALRAEGDGAGAPEARVRLDVDVDAYLPAEYIPFEAAKIDVHRRVAAAREPAELRALRDELRDRFGPPPEPVANLLELQRARVELGRARGARGRVPRRAAVDHAAGARRRRGRARLRERIPEAIYESRTKTLGLRVDDEPGGAAEAVREPREAARRRPGEPPGGGRRWLSR